jgi:DNA-binding protein Fis
MTPKKGLSGLVDEFLSSYIENLQGSMPPCDFYNIIIQEVERPLLKKVLMLSEGNQKRAAEILGINRNTLRKKINDLGINIHDLQAL